jgi:hypothetical protein
MNLLLVEPAELDADNVATVDGARTRHPRQALGAEPGQRVRRARRRTCRGELPIVQQRRLNGQNRARSASLSHGASPRE